MCRNVFCLFSIMFLRTHYVWCGSDKNCIILTEVMVLTFGLFSGCWRFSHRYARPSRFSALLMCVQALYGFPALLVKLNDIYSLVSTNHTKFRRLKHIKASSRVIFCTIAVKHMHCEKRYTKQVNWIKYWNILKCL